MEALFKQTFCDAISENRNKAFGQYELRTNYNDRIFKAQIWVISSFSFLVLLSIWLSPEIKADEVKDISIPVIIREIEIMDLKKPITKADQPEQKLPRENQPKPADPTQSRLLPTELVNEDNKLKIDSTAPISTSDLKTEKQNNHGTDVATTGEPGLKTNGEGGPQKSGDGNAMGSEADKAPYDFVEIEPAFQGDLQSYISKSTNYPGKAIHEGIEGQVFVCFVIDEQGKVTKPEILKGIGYGCDEEALRVVKNLPAFSPGKMNGKPVKVRMRIPLSFRLRK